MFRLAVTSSVLQCVTDAEDTQLATGHRECGDVKQTCRFCVCLSLAACSAPSIPCSPTYTSMSMSFCPILHLDVFSARGVVQKAASDVCTD